MWRPATLRLAVSLLIGLTQVYAGAARAVPSESGGPTPLEQAVAWYQQGRFADARQAFERLAQVGVAGAAHNLAVMHIRRELPEASMREAERLMTRAAELGFVTAMVGLAELYEQGAIDGRRDLAAAHRWHLRAAQAGSPHAQIEAATGYYLGRGVSRDYGAAAHWYRRAARQGDGGAQYLLASMYEQGLGVPRDLRLARAWYAASARGGDPAARGKVHEIDERLRSEAPH